MPEPNHRPPYRFEEGLGSAPLWMLIEQRAVIAIECDNCNRRAEWSADYMQRRLGKWRNRNIRQIAPLLRCFQCRSNWLRIWRVDKRKNLPSTF
jgi:hypothetical protein